MKFYNREKEIKLLANIQEAADENAQMVTLMGRRRIGKTKLLFHATQDTPTLYFFVARKAEPLLCRDFIDEITSVLRLPIYGEIQDFKTIFQLLMDYSKTMKFNLVIDEFQEFYTINPSVYSDMQHLWDRNKDDSHICLFLCGSIYSLMHRIFEGNHEPLFGRATQQIFLKPFHHRLPGQPSKVLAVPKRELFKMIFSIFEFNPLINNESHLGISLFFKFSKYAIIELNSD